MSTEASDPPILDWIVAEPLSERVATLRRIAGHTTATRLGYGRATLPAEDRAHRWGTHCPFDDGDLFAQRLAALHITEDEFRCVVDDDECGRLYGGTPPAWLQTVHDVYSQAPPVQSALSPGASSTGDALLAFLRVAEPLIEHFVTRLRDRAEEIARDDRSVLFDAQNAARLCAGGLLDSFKRMLAPTMILQLNLARLDQQLAGETAAERYQSFLRGLRDRAVAVETLKAYPVLARQLVRRGGQWLASAAAFLSDLSRDWPAIRASFAPDADPGQLIRVQGHLGDTHRGGRSVLVASFTSGLRLVYKPRSLAVDLHFQELLGWLNQRTGRLTFPTLAILDCDSHGWMEFVSPGSCGSMDGIRRFYERQGGYLAIVHLLSGSDLHCENVIANGEHPVLVDLEALFHPRLPAGGARLQGIDVEAWDTSVLRTGLLPTPLRLGDAAPPLDRSGLGAPQSQVTPFGVSCPEGVGTDEMRLVRRQVAIRPAAHWPSINGRPVESLDVDAIVRGFETVYRTVLTHREDLLAAGGPIARFQNDEVRVVLRHTLTYARLLAESFHPDVLRHALDRDQLFDLLWGQVPDTPHLGPVVTLECQDLWNGDVPLFIGRVGSRDLASSTGRCLRDYLPEATDQPVRRRIQRMEASDLERQTWLIRASLATLGPDRTRAMRRGAVAVRSREDQSTSSRLIAQACLIGDRLETLAQRSHEEAGWMGLRHDGKEEWSLRPVGPDLYEGTAGIVLFLAYLAAVTQEARYERLALAGAATLRHQVSALQDVPYGIGAFSGWGGLIYVYGHLAMLWNRAELLDEAQGMADRLPALIDQDVLYDVVGGAAGCICSLLVLYDLAPSNALMLRLTRCGDRLVERARQMQAGMGWPSALYGVPLGGFSHGASGIAHALLALYRRCGEPRFRDTAMAALEYERSLFDDETRQWADLRPHDGARSPRAPMVAWCHGAAGIALSRVSMRLDSNAGGGAGTDPVLEAEADRVDREIDHAIAASLASGFGDNHSLCHGDLGNLDVLLQAGEALRNDVWRGHVNRLTATILDDIERRGWICGISKPVDTPGLMTGIAGIGYGLLRMVQPHTVPSVLTLSSPRVMARPGLDAVSAAT